MSEKRDYESIEKAFKDALKAAGRSVRGHIEKPEPVSRRVRRQLEKASLENRLSAVFSRIGRAVYERSSRQTGSDERSDTQLDRLIEEASDLEKQLAQIRMEIERDQGREEGPLS